MNERDFKAKLQKHLKPHCHIQSMSSYATNGTPDYWLSGPLGDCWVEVKFDATTKGDILPKLSALQRKWCNDRNAEGRSVYVVVGTSTSEGVLFRLGEWNLKSGLRLSFDSIIQELLTGVSK